MESSAAPGCSGRREDSRKKSRVKRMPEDAAARDRLLAAAIAEFARLGYELGTVRNICQRAGVNLNAVKYYFGDKQGLYVEAVRAAHRATHAATALVDVDKIAELFQGSPEQRLRSFIGGMVAMSMSAQDRADVNHQLMFREISNPTEATRQIVREFIRPHFERLNLILKDLLPAGTPQLDRWLLAFGVVGQCMHYKLAGPIIPMLLPDTQRRRLTPERVAEHIAQTTLAAIAARSGKKAKRKRAASKE